MAYLSPESVIKILKEGKTPDEELNWCKEHDQRTFFHTEPVLEKSKLAYYRKYSEWIKTIIHKDKHAVFEALNIPPIATVDFTEGVLSQFKKIFEAQDRYIGFRFKNDEDHDDALRYLLKLNDGDFWSTEAFTTMRSAINSLMVVDIPPLVANEEGVLMQTTQKPEPYYYLVKPEYIVNYSYDKEFQYVIIKSQKQENVWHQYDSESYKIIEKNANSGGYVFTEFFHDLGYTPVKTFWSTFFNSKSKIQRKSPLTNSLGELDYLLFDYISAKHSKLQSGFPITVMYEQKCSYRDEQGNYCEDGRVSYILNEETHYKSCPACGNRDAILGAGQIIKAPARATSEDADMIDGIKHVSGDVLTLEFISKSIKQKEDALYKNIAGFVQESKDAMNVEQVMSNYDSRYNALLDVKKNFEIIHKWTIDTVFKLRYGQSIYLGSTVHYGTKFFLFDADTLNKSYMNSKASGIPNYELSNQINQIIYTRYKNNPDMLYRVKLFSELEPYQGYTIQDLADLKNIDVTVIDPIQLKIKINFNKYIEKLEREMNASITSIMPEISFKKKIEIISNKLIEYANEDNSSTINVNQD